MHDQWLWRTTTLVAPLALFVAAGCGGKDKSAATRSTMPNGQTTTTSSQYTGPTGTTSGNVTPGPGSATLRTQQQLPEAVEGGDLGRERASDHLHHPPREGIPMGWGPEGGGSQRGSTDLSSLNDDQIMAISGATNSAELDQAELVKDRAKSAQVKRFAERILADHGQIAREQSQLIAKLNATPVQTMTSQQLASDSRQLTEALRKEKGDDFDKDYIDAQVREHRDLLNMLDNNLIPQAKSAEFKTSLQNVRLKVESHLRDAESLQRMLLKP
jgi:putative membrane protein